MSWGRNWGRRWGGGEESSVAFTIASALATAANTVRVTFTKPPRHQSPLLPGDASNLQLWTLSRIDKAQILTMFTSRQVTGDPNSIEFLIFERWAGSLAQYRIVGSAALRASDGFELITTPAQADFNGTPPIIPVTERQRPLSDIKNPQTVPDQFNGGLVVGSDGDYEHEEGEPLLKKLIQRRIFIAQAEFMHLADVEYGEGLREKELYADSDIAGIQRRLKNGVSKEPEVLAADVQVTRYPDGRIEVFVKAKTNFGSVEVTAPLSGVQL